MITETQTRIIVLQLSDELLTQLRPFMAGLDITSTPHSEWFIRKSTSRVSSLFTRKSSGAASD